MKTSVEPTSNNTMKVSSNAFKTAMKDLSVNRNLYIMLFPVVLYYLLFCYKPMYGILMAFHDFKPSKGILGSDFVGIKHFINFFSSYNFTMVVRNTLLINFYDILFAFPAPIILALMLNEVQNARFKKICQTITYMPHFISLVVVCGIIKNLTESDGLINDMIVFMGGERTSLLLRAEYFRTIYISSGIWQHIGWGATIYLAALSGIDQELYEAAQIDGASRFKQIIFITIPSIMPVIFIMLILRVGSIMNVGFEKIILLYNPATYETADVISSFIYRKGLLEFNYSFSTAVGLFNSVINFILLLSTNHLSRKFNQMGLW